MFADCFQAILASILKNLEGFDHRSKIHTNSIRRVRAVFFNAIKVPLTFCLDIKEFCFFEAFYKSHELSASSVFTSSFVAPIKVSLFLHHSVYNFNKYYILSELARWKYISGLC